MPTHIKHSIKHIREKTRNPLTQNFASYIIENMILKFEAWFAQQFYKPFRENALNAVSKPRDYYLELYDRSEIWQTHRHSVKFRNDAIISTTILAALRLHETLR